jgi:hypothetical protein
MNLFYKLKNIYYVVLSLSLFFFIDQAVFYLNFFNMNIEQPSEKALDFVSVVKLPALEKDLSCDSEQINLASFVTYHGFVNRFDWKLPKHLIGSSLGRVNNKFYTLVEGEEIKFDEQNLVVFIDENQIPVIKERDCAPVSLVIKPLPEPSSEGCLSAKYLGRDEFLSYHEGVQHYFMQFNTQNEPIKVFKGQKLMNQSGTWLSYKDGVGEALPLIVIKECNEGHVELEYYDELGIEKKIINLHRVMKKAFSFRELSQIKFLSMNGPNSSFCEINSKEQSIKTNDWLLFYEGNWQFLRGFSDIERYLNKETTGLLLVIENFLNDSQGDFFIGRLYDSQRLQVLEIVFPLSAHMNFLELYSQGEQ